MSGWWWDHESRTIRAPFNSEENERATKDAFEWPRVGDRFTEMCSFWVYVVGVEDGFIATLEGSGPITFPDEGKLVIQSEHGYRARWAYGSIPGYSIRLVSRNENVAGWLMSKLMADGHYAKEVVDGQHASRT